MKRSVVCLLIMLVVVSSGFSQEVELSPKHQAKLAKITDKYEHALKYKKYYRKDSIKLAKRLKKEAKLLAKQTADKNLNEITEYTQGKEIIEDVKLKKGNIPSDSTEILDVGKELAQSELSQQTGINVPDIAIDSTTTDKIKDTAVKEGENLLKDTKEYKELSGLENDSEFGKLSEQKANLEKTQEELRQIAAQQELKQKLTSQAKDFITENVEQISEVQSNMTELKQKYSSVPNSNDLSTAMKRNSLKGEPIWKRFFLGGNFNITKTEPFTMDLSPMLGYRVNKLFDVGFSAIYRNQFSRKSTSIDEHSVYGYSVLANHLFYKNYFGYLEGEKISSVAPLDVTKTRSWKESLLLGVGRKFNITKWLEMQAIVSVNLLHKNSDELYSSPVVFKTGIRVKL